MLSSLSRPHAICPLAHSACVHCVQLLIRLQAALCGTTPNCEVTLLSVSTGPLARRHMVGDVGRRELDAGRVAAGGEEAAEQLAMAELGMGVSRVEVLRTVRLPSSDEGVGGDNAEGSSDHVREGGMQSDAQGDMIVGSSRHLSRTARVQIYVSQYGEAADATLIEYSKHMSPNPHVSQTDVASSLL